MEKTKVIGTVLGLVTAVSVAQADYSFTYGGKAYRDFEGVIVPGRPR